MVIFARSVGVSHGRQVGFGLRALLLGCTTFATGLGLAAGAHAQSTAATPNTLQEIVVTAQRREQNVQNVPIAVTALTQAELATNRVTSVNDLSLLSPGLTVMPSAGGTQIPTFTMRGITSYGVVPGSDKAISMYVDGVYISSARGSIFDLPDISQLEVLRGPQGTLFGRNATGGAISITTRDPTGKFGFAQDFTGGNYDQFRSRTTIDTPSWGPFSAYVSYVHNERRGDTENEGAGTVWNYSNAAAKAASIPSTMTSPKYLGSHNENNVFAALKYQPTDWFSTVYKFDYSDDHATPEAVGYLNSATIPFLIGNGTLTPTTPVIANTSGTRPSEVNNAFSTPRHQVTQGHSLTTRIQGENYTIKNIAAYRESYLIASDALDGLGGLTTGPLFGPFAGLPVEILGITNQTQSRQWSDELQYIYHSKLLTLTVGGLVFETKDQNGAIPGFANNVTSLGVAAITPLTPSANGIVVPAGQSLFYNKGQSIAAYTQIELHVTSNVDLVGGIRETKDWKSGSNILPAAAFTAGAPHSFSYTANAPSYLIGVNYKPTADILLYGKYSTAFVSGGAVSGIPFVPETVQSWEAGFKGEFLEHRLRTNLSIYEAKYYNLQEAEGGSTFENVQLKTQYPWIPDLGTFIVDQGGYETAKGVEFEGTWLVGHGVTLGSNVAYTDAKYYNVNPDVDNPTGVPPIPTLQPKWTLGLWGNYATTFANGLKGSVRIDADWRSDLPLDNPELVVSSPAYAPYINSPATWIVNGRAVLSGFQMHGVNAQVAVWGKNLTNDGSLNYALLIPGLLGSGNFQPARTFGVDVDFKY